MSSKLTLRTIMMVWIPLLLTGYCSAQSNYDGTAIINTATDQYAIGLFDSCITNLSELLRSKGSNFDQRLHANKIMAMCYLATDQNSSADSVITTLLYMQPDFEPDMVNDPDRFVKALQRVKDSLGNTNSFVTSVSKRAEDIKLAPATTVVITQEQIRQRGYNDLIDILKDIPGFDISVYYGELYASIYLRGFRTKNTDKILLLIDGVEDNDVWSNWADISQQYPVANIKRVEVIYGPASTMYGPNAYSGVINVITKSAGDYLHNGHPFGMQVSAGYGSYNTRYIEAGIGYKKNLFSFSVTGRLYYSDRPDLSSQSLWDYNPHSARILQNSDSVYKAKLQRSNGGAAYLKNNNIDLRQQFKVIPIMQGNITIYDTVKLTQDGYIESHTFKNSLYLTDSGAARARELDSLGYTNPPSTAFHNSAEAFYLQAKMTISGLTIGVMSWNKDEGSGTAGTDNSAPSLFVNGTRWKPLHNAVYFNYNRRINNKTDFSVLANYRLHKINNGTKQTAFYGYGQNTGFRIFDMAALEKGMLAIDTNYYYEQSSQFRSEIRLAYTQSKYFNIVGGVEVRNSLLQGYFIKDDTYPPQNTGKPSRTVNGGSHFNANDIGVYSQAALRSRNGWGLTLGARVDHNAFKKGQGSGYSFSPRLVGDYSINKNWIVKSIYSTGLQNISNFTRSYGTGNAFDSSFEPERISNFEISSAFTLQHNLSADIDFYYSKIKDIIGVTQDNQVKNNSAYRIHGIQANASYSIHNLQIALNYSFTSPKQIKGTVQTKDSIIDIKDTSNFTLADIAAHKANFIVNYNFLKHYNLNLIINYVGSKKAGPGTSIPSNSISGFPAYYLGNIAASVSDPFNLKGVMIQFKCNNFLDKLYYSPGIRGADGIGSPDEIMQMGRNYSIRVNYEF